MAHPPDAPPPAAPAYVLRVLPMRRGVQARLYRVTPHGLAQVERRHDSKRGHEAWVERTRARLGQRGAVIGDWDANMGARPH